jgi:hypothetical protein
MAWSGTDRRQTKRHYLGKASGSGSRMRVYQTREAIEVDELEGYDVVRKRVFYDDVVLVTQHQFMGWTTVATLAVLTLLFGAFSIAVGIGEPWPTKVGVLAVTTLPFLVALVLRIAFRVDAVTVYGRRTRAQIHFAFRKERARRTFNQICRAVKETQDRIAREASRPAPAPRPPLAPPPPSVAG